jgi:hypothetical protein
LVKYEKVSATLHEDGLVCIRTIRIRRGVDVGGSLWLGMGALPWLITALEACVGDLTGSQCEIGADTLRVREKGHEFDPMVGIGNQRSGKVAHAGRYFVAMREATALELVEQLRVLLEEAG